MTNPVTGEIANIGMVDTVSIGPNGEGLSSVGNWRYTRTISDRQDHCSGV